MTALAFTAGAIAYGFVITFILAAFHVGSNADAAPEMSLENVSEQARSAIWRDVVLGGAVDHGSVQ